MSCGPIHVVSLGRTPARWAAFQADNPELQARRFPAVDGRTTDRAALVAGGLLHPALDYTPGAVGCALSHIALWTVCAERGETLTVCEDDAVLRADFTAAAADTLASAPGAELVLWGWNFDSVLAGRLFGDTPYAMGFDQARMRADIPAFRAGRERATLLRLHRALGTPAYTLTPIGAQALLTRCLPLRPLTIYMPLLDRELANTGVDIAMNATYPDMAAYAAFPPLALTRNDVAASTVEDA